MRKETPNGMGLKRIETRMEDDYLEFLIFHDDGSEGSADLRIMELESTHHTWHAIRGENLPLGSRIAETFFYPHSATSERGRGAGSEALAFVLDEARRRDIRLVYAQITSPEAGDFFSKRGFVGDFAPHCYFVVR